MIDTKKSHGVYFAENKEDPFDVIIKILERNNLKENFDDAVNKRKEGKISGIDFLYAAAKTIAIGELNERDFILSAQKQLGVSPETAQNLNRDVKSMLLPLAVKERIGQPAPVEKEKPITAQPTRLIDELKENSKENIVSPEEPAIASPKNPIKKNNKPVKEISEETSKLPKKSIAQPPRQKSSGPDSYREPVG